MHALHFNTETSADYEVHISPTSSRIQALTPFPANDPSYLHTHASAREQTHSSEENEEEGRRKTRERDIDVHDARVLIKVQGKW